MKFQKSVIQVMLVIILTGVSLYFAGSVSKDKTGPLVIEAYTTVFGQDVSSCLYEVYNNPASVLSLDEQRKQKITEISEKTNLIVGVTFIVYLLILYIASCAIVWLVSRKHNKSHHSQP